MSDNDLSMGPYLNIATISERHIQEADGALTLFRIVDRFMISGSAKDMEPVVLKFEVVVCFRSGGYRGSLDMDLSCLGPSMNVLSAMTVPIRFEGDDERSANTYGVVNLQVNEEGLHWIIVTLAKVERTRIPFRVVYQRQPTVSTGG